MMQKKINERKEIIKHTLPEHEKIKLLKSKILEKVKNQRGEIINKITAYIKNNWKKEIVEQIGVENHMLEIIDRLEKTVKGELNNTLQTNKEEAIIEKAAELLQIHLILDKEKVQEVILKQIKEKLNIK